MTKLTLILLIFLCNLHGALALNPSSKLVPLAKVGFVSNYQDASGNIHLSKMPSDFSYKDLTETQIKELDKAHNLKKEYGSLFGFNDWKVGIQELVNKESERILLLVGNYKNGDGKLVSFVEVYWANQSEAKQFLITSEKQSFNLDSYTDYLE